MNAPANITSKGRLTHIIGAVVDVEFEGGLPAILNALETTNTEIIVRMVEAGLGVSVVPLMPDGSAPRGRKVMAKQMAGIRASGAGLGFGPVVNNLSVDQPAKKKS